MSLRFYGLKSCDTCRAALKALAAAGISPDVFDVRADGLPDETILQLIDTHGVDTVINRRSTTWRGLDAAAQTGDPVALIKANPTLIKRPVIIKEDGTSYIGWNAEVGAALGMAAG